MKDQRPTGKPLGMPGRHHCPISLPYFSFRRRSDRLSRIRRQYYLLEEQLHPRSSLRRFIYLFTWPLKSLQSAIRASGLWALDAQAAGAPSRFRQCLQVWWLALRHNLSYRVYYAYRLWRHRPGIATTDWLDEFEAVWMHRLFTDLEAATWLDDKELFGRFCAEHGFPSLPILGVVTAETGLIRSDPQRPLPAVDLFAKPTHLYQGLGAAVYVWDEAAQCWRIDGEQLGEPELLDRLRERAGDSRYLLQERARNHPSIADLSPDALCTLRCVTYRFPDEPARHFRSVLRMGRKGAVTDHPVRGGFLAAVSRDGELRRAKSKQVGLERDRHPDTGAQISGRSLEQFTDMVALATRAHDAAGLSGVLAWDIAITADGPLLVESNPVGSSELLQAATDEPLGQGEFLDIVERLLREQASSSR